MSMRATAALLVSALVLGFLPACEDDLPKATLIARMRVLGVQLSVEGDEARTTPQPGERVGLAFPVVYPTLAEDTSAAQMLLIGCTAPDRFTGGLPICQEFIDAVLAGDDPGAALPMLDGGTVSCADLRGLSFQRGALSLACVRGAPRATLSVPADFAAHAMLFRGVICERGTPYIDPNDPLLFGCENEDAEPIRVHGQVPVQYEAAAANHNPDMTALSLVRENVPWPAFDPDDLPPEQGCAGALPTNFGQPVHRVVTGAHRIELRYQAAARERASGEPETLEFTIYATLGEMERRFTLFTPDDEVVRGVLSSSLDWTPPRAAELPRGGQLVRFFVTVRDQRGGFGMTERAVCVRGR
jgi:hypothetical protein